MSLRWTLHNLCVKKLSLCLRKSICHGVLLIFPSGKIYLSFSGAFIILKIEENPFFKNQLSVNKKPGSSEYK